MCEVRDSREGRKNDLELNLHAMVEGVGLHAAVFGRTKQLLLLIYWPRDYVMA